MEYENRLGELEVELETKKKEVGVRGRREKRKLHSSQLYSFEDLGVYPTTFHVSFANADARLLHNSSPLKLPNRNGDACPHAPLVLVTLPPRMRRLFYSPFPRACASCFSHPSPAHAPLVLFTLPPRMRLLFYSPFPRACAYCFSHPSPAHAPLVLFTLPPRIHLYSPFPRACASCFIHPSPAHAPIVLVTLPPHAPLVLFTLPPRMHLLF